MRHLELVFKSEDNKVKKLKLNYVNESLTEATIKQAMADMASLQMFKKDGVSMYAKPVAAQYVDNNTTSVFDDRTTNAANPSTAK
ncbi:hypothetical protein WR164_12560 [Philodulcilactobacillus myokoensis]|uniref:DUF2922 domain-containing protein n=1 Tax=Philodulcilactobacillus myokoensis TaxID=2929573 RepID=A0A9W6B1R6_9LACO|nr:DUF2922 domain-containing protein [Philodulcilactobacillus myokoensis]GLB47277.1 hypothetical protein WR164_12560 [Philodulcilactobacillus myokoensis]